MGNRGAAWAVAAPLIAFKVWVTIILLTIEPSREAIGIAIATGWPWLVVGGVLIAGPLLGWARLVRVRRRRERLRRSEWMVGEQRPQPVGQSSTPFGTVAAHWLSHRRN